MMAGSVSVHAFSSRPLRNVRDLPKGQPLYIYGSGRGGLLLLAAIQAVPGLSVAGFIDSHRSGVVAGLQRHAVRDFFRPGAVVSDPTDAIIIVASQDWSDIGETLALLRARHVHNASGWVRRQVAQADHPAVRGLKTTVLRHLPAVGTLLAGVTLVWLLRSLR